jgi:hypothetical protein
MTWRIFPPVGKKLVIWRRYPTEKLADFRHFPKLA